MSNIPQASNEAAKTVAPGEAKPAVQQNQRDGKAEPAKPEQK